MSKTKWQYLCLVLFLTIVFKMILEYHSYIEVESKDNSILRTQGELRLDSLTNVLVDNQPVFLSNGKSVDCTYDGNTIKIDSPFDFESIRIFRMNGESVLGLEKRGNPIQYPLKLSQGIYIITGFNWCYKLIVK